jgi:hypothetical protein
MSGLKGTRADGGPDVIQSAPGQCLKKKDKMKGGNDLRSCTKSNDTGRGPRPNQVGRQKGAFCPSQRNLGPTQLHTSCVSERGEIGCIQYRLDGAGVFVEDEGRRWEAAKIIGRCRDTNDFDGSPAERPRVRLSDSGRHKQRGVILRRDSNPRRGVRLGCFCVTVSENGKYLCH